MTSRGPPGLIRQGSLLLGRLNGHSGAKPNAIEVNFAYPQGSWTALHQDGLDADGRFWQNSSLLSVTSGVAAALRAEGRSVAIVSPKWVFIDRCLCHLSYPSVLPSLPWSAVNVVGYAELF